MNNSPFAVDIAFSLGRIAVSEAVVVTWLIMAALTLSSALLTRKLSLYPSKTQAGLELLISVIDSHIRDTMQTAPQRYRALIGTLFLFILVSNWTSLLPALEPPTATLETDIALALIVLLATLIFGVTSRGWRGYLRTFIEPSWVMIPVNIFQQITRSFSMFIRLFGNVMSGVFVAGIMLSLAGFLVPIPLMALDLLTGAVQAYIFAILSMVFIGAAISRDSDQAADDSAN